MRNVVIFAISVAGTIGAGLWFYFSPEWEPALLVLGGVGGVFSTWPFSGKQRITPEQKIEKREEYRPIFKQFFWEHKEHGTDAIIHDVGRVDTYPDMPVEPGISSWYRAGLMGTYHRGILLGLRWADIAQQKNGKWVEVAHDAPGALRVVLVGKVPYECIQKVNFDGDEFYNKPHLYLHFDFAGEPYEQIAFATEGRINGGAPFYTDVVDYADTLPPLFSWRHPIKSVKRFLF